MIPIASALLPLVLQASPSYWGSYSHYIQSKHDAAFVNRTSVFSATSFSLSDLGGGPESPKWFLSNATASSVDGALRLSSDAWGLNSSVTGPKYGTLWFGQKLPLDGVAVEWTYSFPDVLNAHDMNWWFPCPVAKNTVYSDFGTSSPFFVWGANGWGGRLSGLEISDGGSTLTEAALPQPGVFHSALYYSKGTEQFFFLDNRLVMSYSGRKLNTTSGYFAFSVFESTVLLGAVNVYLL